MTLSDVIETWRPSALAYLALLTYPEARFAAEYDFSHGFASYPKEVSRS